MLPSGGASPFVGDRRTSVTRHPFAPYSAAKLASPRETSTPSLTRYRLAHGCSEQSAPKNGYSQAHLPVPPTQSISPVSTSRSQICCESHAPRPEQSFGHETCEQSRLPCPGKHRHTGGNCDVSQAPLPTAQSLAHRNAYAAPSSPGRAGCWRGRPGCRRPPASRPSPAPRRRRHRLAPVVGDVVRRQHADGRRPELALRGPRPRVWHVHGDGDVHLGQRAFGVVVDADAADAGDDGQARAGGLPDGFVPRGQGLELLPALGVGSRAARHALHQTQQVLRLERRADQVHVRDVRRLHHRVHETQPAVVQKQVQEVRRVVAPEVARNHARVPPRVVRRVRRRRGVVRQKLRVRPRRRVRVRPAGRGDLHHHLQVVEPPRGERVPRAGHGGQEASVRVPRARDEVVRRARPAPARGLPHHRRASRGVLHEVLQLHHPALGVASHQAGLRRAVARHLQLLRAHASLQRADQVHHLVRDAGRAHRRDERAALR